MGVGIVEVLEWPCAEPTPLTSFGIWGEPKNWVHLSSWTIILSSKSGISIPFIELKSSLDFPKAEVLLNYVWLEIYFNRWADFL